MIDIPETFRVH